MGDQIETHQLTRRCRAIAAAERVEQVKGIRDVMRAYARQADNHDMEADAIEIRMRGTRRMDQMRREQKEVGKPGRALAVPTTDCLGSDVKQPNTLAAAGKRNYCTDVVGDVGTQLGAGVPAARSALTQSGCVRKSSVRQRREVD
jgi:hypothetical protein